MTDGTTDVSTPIEEQATTEDSINRENKYKELQGDYTRKSQELATMKKEPATSRTEEEENLSQRVKDDMKDELDKREERLLNKFAFDKLLTNYPELRKSEKAIRDLQSVNGGSFEEVAINYGFTTTDKLEKARSRDVMVGSDSKTPSKTISVRDLSATEYAKWKKDNISDNDSFERMGAI